jgi:TRAP-type transport system small permease protein
MRETNDLWRRLRRPALKLLVRARQLVPSAASLERGRGLLADWRTQVPRLLTVEQRPSLKQITQWLSDGAAIAIAAMIAITIADVLMKNVFNRPIKGAFELVELMLVFVVFFGLAEIFRSDTNICVDVVDQFVSAPRQAAMKAFGAVASLVFLLLMGWAMIGPWLDTVRYPQRTQELGIAHTLYWMPILVGTVVTIVAAAVVAWTHVRPPAGQDAR